METGSPSKQKLAHSGSYAFRGSKWPPTPRLARILSPSHSIWLSSLAYSDGFQYSPEGRPRRLAPLPEPHLLRVRPTSLRTQDISHLLTGVFRNLYSAEVIGEEVSASLIKARGSDDERHEEFVDELQKVRNVYKKRLDEVEMLERHIIQAYARSLAEKERAMHQLQALESFIKMPPVQTIFRWCVDNELLQKHHLISPDDYYNDPVPFCSPPKGISSPGPSKPTYSYEKRSIAQKAAAPFRKAITKCEEISDYSIGSLTKDSSVQAKVRTKESTTKASQPKNKRWMNHLRVPQRELERLLLARMENRNYFLKNPRFFPPNTPHGGKSLIFPPKKPAQRRESKSLDLEQQSYAETPVFLAKPSIGFFTDYEIGPVYEAGEKTSSRMASQGPAVLRPSSITAWAPHKAEPEMVISLQNTTATSRHLRVLPPSTPYFSLGLGMFPGQGGMVAPGLTCQYTVQFFPDCLGDFDDFILVETQSAHTLLIPLQARRPPPVLTLSPVLECGYCLIGGVKMTRFFCRNVGFSVGKFCIMPKSSWPPPSFRAVAISGFVEQPPFGIRPSVFELAPGQTILVEVLFLPTELGKAEQTFIVVCDNCQVKELVTEGVGQLVALDLIYISGDKSQPEPGELTDLTAQHFIRFEPENLQSTVRKQLVIRNATHVELAFHWQIMKPNLKPLLPWETFSLDSIKYHPDWESAFYITPQQGLLSPHMDHEFILSFSPHEPRDFHSVLQMVLEDIPEPMSSGPEAMRDQSFFMDDVIVLEVEVKGSVEPFQVLLEPYALIIPGENYIGITMKKEFKMWNNSKSPIRYTWRKISDCHIVEVEPCEGAIEPSEVEHFELNITGSVPGPASLDLLCDIKNSPSPAVLHIEATFKGPVLVISVSALHFGLLRLGQKSTSCIQIQNVSQLPATWSLRESQDCLEERCEHVSPFDIEPSSGHMLPLGQCKVNITLEALSCQRLETVLELMVVNGAWSYLPVYAEVQKPHVYLLNSFVEVSNLYVGVPTKAVITLINGTLLPTQFYWGKLLGHQASSCTIKVFPRQGLLGPSEERLLHLEFTANTQEELTDLAFPCHITGMDKPLVLGISGKPQGLNVTIEVFEESSECSVPFSDVYPGHPEELRLDFGSTVPLRTLVTRQVTLTNLSPILAPFTLEFEYFRSPQDSLSRKPSLPDIPVSLLKTARMQKQLAKREEHFFMENMLSYGKGAAFFPHVAQGLLGAHQQLRINITGCANMWGEYWDKLICTVGDQAPTVIPVYLVAVGCPISSLRPTYRIADQFQKEPIIRFGTQVSGGVTIIRTIRLNNSSPCDIRLDWETYSPDCREDKLLDLLVFYGPLFPLRDHLGNELLSPETPGSVTGPPSCPSSGSDYSPDAPSAQKVISVILQEHEGVPSSLYQISPRQLVVPAGGSSSISISFTPLVLGPEILHKVDCAGYALGFMSLDNEVERELPGKRRRGQDFAVGPLRLDLHGCVRPAQLSMELDYGRGMVFRHQASDLIPEHPCSGVLAELVTTQHLKLTNNTEIPHYFRLLVSKPFSVSQEGAKHSRGAPIQGTAAEDKQLVLPPQENMLVNVSFSLSLELLSYQKLPADQMLPGVEIQKKANGEKEMVFTQNLLLQYNNQTMQVVPLRAVVAVPELQLSTSWVDFGTCFVNQGRVREVYLLNLSGCTSYWTVLMGQQKPDKDPAAFWVSPSSGLLQARSVNAPPTSIPLQILFKASNSQLYESTLVVEGVLGEKVCMLRLRGKGSNDEKYMVRQ